MRCSVYRRSAFPCSLVDSTDDNRVRAKPEVLISISFGTLSQHRPVISVEASNHFFVNICC